MDFTDRRVLLITGKGGVGRTVVSVALATALAQRGKRVLLLEIGDAEGGYSAIGRRFGHETLHATPRSVASGLSLAHLWAPTGHEGFLRSVLPAGPLIKAGLRSKALQRFLLAAPSFHEMGVFYHLYMFLMQTRGDGEPTYDAVIIDMPATGHALALTGLPEVLLRLIPGGPIAKAIKTAQAILNNPETGGAWTVTLPEQLPVTETLELIKGLSETAMPAAGVLLNRFPKDPFTAKERAFIEDLLDKGPMHGEVAFRKLAAADTAAVRLEAEAGVPVVRLPDTGTASDPVPPLVACFLEYIDAYTEAKP